MGVWWKRTYDRRRIAKLLETAWRKSQLCTKLEWLPTGDTTGFIVGCGFLFFIVYPAAHLTLRRILPHLPPRPCRGRSHRLSKTLGLFSPRYGRSCDQFTIITEKMASPCQPTVKKRLVERQQIRYQAVTDPDPPRDLSSGSMYAAVAKGYFNSLLRFLPSARVASFPIRSGHSGYPNQQLCLVSGNILLPLRRPFYMRYRHHADLGHF